MSGDFLQTVSVSRTLRASQLCSSRARSRKLQCDVNGWALYNGIIFTAEYNGAPTSTWQS